ncbi:MAG: hypothetical protein NTW06_01810 [Candidatus Falkowbacteria bacterium]|nr:hypothetical protein [Candidatus Falkowbacteria bacterium]
MDRKIQCENKSKQESIRVRVIKAPLVNTAELKQILLARTRALVL